ncbi:MAG TPA: site-2 protease family protein [Acidimicrobiales bacterium]|nr:site-2 protease family protein [Acidimicrobiales bacterium]
MSDPWPSPPPRRTGIDPRTAIWVIAGVALAIVLVRSHRIEGFSLLILVALIPSVILHEVSHGAVAYAFGDDTAKRAGRLTLNPVSHVDPFGTIILPAIMSLSGVGAFGYAKPVPVTPSRLRSPRNQGVLVSLVGPGVNMVLAAAFAVAYRAGVPEATKVIPLGVQPTWAQFLFAAGYINVVLAAFNLIPLPPLDGSVVIERMLPARALPRYYRIRPFTMLLPLVLILIPGALDRILNPVVNWWAGVVHLGG